MRASGARREGRPQRSLAGHAGRAQLAQARVAGRRRRQLRALEAHRAHHLPHSMPCRCPNKALHQALPPVATASMAWGLQQRDGGNRSHGGGADSKAPRRPRSAPASSRTGRARMAGAGAGQGSARRAHTAPR